MARPCNKDYYIKQRAVNKEKMTLEAFRDWENKTCKNCPHHLVLCTKDDLYLKIAAKKVTDNG